MVAAILMESDMKLSDDLLELIIDKVCLSFILALFIHKKIYIYMYIYWLYISVFLKSVSLSMAHIVLASLADIC